MLGVGLLAGWLRGGEHVGPYLPRDHYPFVLLEAGEIQHGTACYRNGKRASQSTVKAGTNVWTAQISEELCHPTSAIDHA